MLLVLLAAVNGATATSVPQAAVPALPELSSVQAVLAMPPDQAFHGAPVRLAGRVVYADSVRNQILFRDATGAIPISVDGQKHPVAGGDWVVLEGKTTATLTRYPDFPSGRQPLDSFEAPRTIGTRYLARISGFIHPPRTGEYTFWIASDNSSELWLSTDDQPQSREKLCGSPDLFDYMAFRQWEKFPQQRSAAIHLRAGQKYYIEALHWEEDGEDSLSVAWEGPGIARTVIAGEFLSPRITAGVAPGSGERGTILREFWLNYPIPPPGPATGGVDLATRFRNTSATVQRLLTPPPSHYSAPAIAVAQMTVSQTEPLPQPRVVAAGQAWDAGADYEWSEAEGVIARIAHDGAYWSVIELEGEAQPLVIRIANPAQESLERFWQARARVRGFCAGAFNQRGARVASILWVPGAAHIAVVSPRPEDWARLPSYSVGDLHAGKGSLRAGQRVRLTGRVLASADGQPLLVRDGVSQFSGFVSPDGVTWTRISDPIAIPMTHSVHVGLAVVAAGTNLGTAVFDHLSVPLAAGSGAEVGTPPVRGNSRAEGDTFIVQGSGSNVRVDNSDTARDDMHFVSQSWEGDGELVARILSLTVPESTPFPGGCAGLMLRENLEREAKYAMVSVSTAGGAQFRVRREKANPLESYASGQSPPYWLKVVRESPPPLAVHAAERPALAREETVEVIGVLERSGNAWTLQDAFCRAVSYEAERARAATERTAEINTVQQIRHLDAQALAQARPAKIRGVVTAKTSELYVQDPTGGIRIPAAAFQKFAPFEAGQYIEVSGQCLAGPYSPALMPTQYSDVVVLGAGQMPKPVQRTWNQLMEGRDDALWIEVRGVVRRVGSRTLKLQMAGGSQLVDLAFDLPEAWAERLVDATVRVQGVCQVTANQKKQLVGTRVIVPAAEFVIVDEAARDDPFSIATQPAGDLLQFRDQDDLAHRVKVTGVVTGVRERFFFVEDATGGVKVEPAEQVALTVGDRVEVLGFAHSNGLSVNLIDATTHALGRAPLPEPLKLRERDIPAAAHSSRLIDVSATFLGRSSVLGHEVFQFQRNDRVFQASLPHARGAVPTWESGTVVKLTGVCAVLEGRATASSGENLEFELLLDAPGDLAVLQAPAWWNLRRLLWVGGVFVGVLSIAAVWIAMMLRKNRLLKVAQAQLQDANDRLEARVAHRTADLAKANAELSREQALLRALLDNSPDQIYFKDTQSRFLKTGKAQAKNFGAASADELIGKTDFDYFDERHAGPAYADEQEIVRTGNPIIGKIEKEISKNGEVHWMLTSKLPLRNEAGEIVGTFGVSKDITAMKEAEVKLAEVNKQLVEASRHAGMAEVATNVLHNVGNVLNSVNVSATLVLEQLDRSKVKNVGKLAEMLRAHAANVSEFLTQDPKGQKIPDYLISLAPALAAEQRALTDEINHLRKNVEHIKEVVAMQQSYAKVSGVKEQVAATTLVEEVLRIHAAALARDGIELARECPPDLRLTIDRHKVLQILVNLVSNAMNACSESANAEKRVQVRVEAQASRVRFAVIDSGVGILPENLTRIFEHGFTTRKHGHGFGLHSCALAAKELGGQLEVASEGKGKGAMFTLELPLENPEAAPATRPPFSTAPTG